MSSIIPRPFLVVGLSKMKSRRVGREKGRVTTYVTSKNYSIFSFFILTFESKTLYYINSKLLTISTHSKVKKVRVRGEI